MAIRTDSAARSQTRTQSTTQAKKADETPSWLKPIEKALDAIKDVFDGDSGSGVTRAPQDPRTAAPQAQGAAPRRGLTAANEGGAGTTQPQTPGTPTTPTTPPAPTGEEKFLAKGAAKKTKAAERMLRRAGFNPGKIDSKLSGRSREALEQFQQAAGLPVTGELNERTFKKLKAVESRRAQSKGRTVGPGQRSNDILKQERQLRRLGYDTGKVDGTFDKDTAGAVRAFKADQDNIKSKSGLLGDKAEKILASESRGLNHDAFRSRVILDSKKEKRTHARAERRTENAVQKEHADGTTGLREGSKGASVKYVQQHLRAAGFDPQRTDGVFDERTAGAVKAFQKRSGLEATGEVNASTWRQLRKSKMEATSATSPSQRIGERSGAVKRTERLLQELGYNPGKVDGAYDQRTQNAVDRFRKKERIGGKGKGVTKNTLNRMERVLENRNVDAGELVRIMPGLSRSRARALAPGLNKAMREFGITTEKRKEQFLAQLGHESAGLRYFEEIASGAAYEGRTDLGNTRPGDGVRYKGRGPIQLTGRANYRAAGKALGLPLEQKPWLASRPSVGFRIAGWFWQSRGLNQLADRSAFTTITERINGGHNGLADRYAYWARAKRVI